MRRSARPPQTKVTPRRALEPLPAGDGDDADRRRCAARACRRTPTGRSPAISTSRSLPARTGSLRSGSAAASSSSTNRDDDRPILPDHAVRLGFGARRSPPRVTSRARSIVEASAPKMETHRADAEAADRTRPTARAARCAAACDRAGAASRSRRARRRRRRAARSTTCTISPAVSRRSRRRPAAAEAAGVERLAAGGRIERGAIERRRGTGRRRCRRTAPSRRTLRASRRCSRDASSVSGRQRIGDPGLGEPSRAKPAAVARAARPSVGARVVAAVRQAVVDTELQTEPDDAGLGQVLERRPDSQRPALDAGLRRQRREVLERRDDTPGGSPDTRSSRAR